MYAREEARATYEGMRAAAPERRPFILTRAGFAGTQRYAAVWTGGWSEHMDNASADLADALEPGSVGVDLCGQRRRGLLRRSHARALRSLDGAGFGVALLPRPCHQWCQRSGAVGLRHRGRRHQPGTHSRPLRDAPLPVQPLRRGASHGSADLAADGLRIPGRSGSGRVG